MSATPPVSSVPARPPRAGRWGPGFILALVVHGLLLIALTLGVSWRTADRGGVSAELWAAVPQIAAPREQTPPPQPEPKPEPKPEPPKPEPPKPEAVKPPEPKVDPREAEIAVEKARQEKLQREREEQERKQREEELAKKKAADEAKRRQELEDQREREAKEREAKKREQEQKEREERKRQQEEEQRLAKLRDDQMKRIQGMAGATGEPNSGGSALRSAGPSANYAGRVRARVLPNIVYTREISGNPSAEVTLRAAPDGTVLKRDITKSSGVKAWDDAVLAAIDKTGTMPRDTDGTVPPVITIVFTPN